MVRVCEIELSHMGKANGYPYLVCENVLHKFISKECITETCTYSRGNWARFMFKIVLHFSVVEHLEPLRNYLPRSSGLCVDTKLKHMFSLFPVTLPTSPIRVENVLKTGVKCIGFSSRILNCQSKLSYQ